MGNTNSEGVKKEHITKDVKELSLRLPTNLEDPNLGDIYDNDVKRARKVNAKENQNENSKNIPNEDTVRKY